MGEDLAKELGFSTTLLGATGPKTKAQDTMAAAQAMLEERVDLLLFAGGDGTARNVAAVINTGLPVLGIPAGVKSIPVSSPATRKGPAGSPLSFSPVKSWSWLMAK